MESYPGIYIHCIALFVVEKDILLIIKSLSRQNYSKFLADEVIYDY